MNLRPLADRVLIKPEIPAAVTASGLVLAEQRKPEQTGTVVAVGPCAHPLRAEVEELANRIVGCRKGFEDCQDPDCRSARMLRALVAIEPQVKVGDYVVFSWTSGQEIWVEDGEERYLLMREADILCVVEGLATV